MPRFAEILAHRHGHQLTDWLQSIDTEAERPDPASFATDEPVELGGVPGEPLLGGEVLPPRGVAIKTVPTHSSAI